MGGREEKEEEWEGGGGGVKGRGGEGREEEEEEEKRGGEEGEEEEGSHRELPPLGPVGSGEPPPSTPGPPELRPSSLQPPHPLKLKVGAQQRACFLPQIFSLRALWMGRKRRHQPEAPQAGG